jgi:hypothetical protein
VTEGTPRGDNNLSHSQIHTLLVEEYKLLWSYYIKLLDEKHKTIDYFFKTTAIPAGLITFGAGYFGASGSNPQANAALAIMALLIVGIIGFVSLTVYAKEDANSKIYLDSINAIRTEFTTYDERINRSVIRNKFRSKKCSWHHIAFGSVGMWRGRFISAINSAVFPVSLYLYNIHWKIHDFTIRHYIAVYILSIFLHILWCHHTYLTYIKIYKYSSIKAVLRMQARLGRWPRRP